MNRFSLSALFLLTFFLLTAPRPSAAAESFDNCAGFIISIPTVISTPGTWCLKQDLNTSLSTGAAIDVDADDVVINCNGFKLGGLAAGAGTSTIGVYSINQINTTVRNCNIRGFLAGVYLLGVTSGNAVEDSRFDGNTYIGLRVDGDGSVVRRNRVFDTGESTVFDEAYGIYAVASVDILDNTVSQVTATSGGDNNAYGIYTSANASGRIIGNGVRGLLKAGNGVAHAIDSFSTSNRLAIRDNDLVGDASAGSMGVGCASSFGRAQGNTISHFQSARIACNDSGGNVVIP